MHCKIEEASDGRRLVQVCYEYTQESQVALQFEGQLLMLKTTFELYTPEDFTLKANTSALFHLSTVRTDTMENVPIGSSVMREVMESAVKTAAEDDPDW